jgi:DNA-binding SARP family transcriptional activator
LFVLTDLAEEPTAVPIAAAAFDKDRDSRRARLVFFSANLPFAQRLLDGVFTLLRSDGIELVEANAGQTYSPLLESLGFKGRSRREPAVLVVISSAVEGADISSSARTTDKGNRVSFGYLGELWAELDGRRLDLGPRLQRQLLAILLVEAGRVVSVDRLVDLLWGDTPPSAAIASLQAYVSQLRRIIEPDRPPRTPARVIMTQDPGYALKVEPDDLDGLAFLKMVAEGRDLLDAGMAEDAAARLEDALRLWRGQPLTGFESEPWAVAPAARLTDARDTALEDRMDAWLVLNRHTRAASELEEMVQERPLRERRWAQLILATYRSGRQADALRAYQRCRVVLGDELGIEPGPELRRLEAAVLAQDPSLDLATVEVGPQPAPTKEASPGSPAGTSRPFEVHKVQLDRMQLRIADAADGRGGVVVLVGEPGVGKTTLAERAAEMAAGAGLCSVWSRCLDASSAPAYWPWVQLFRRVAQTPKVVEARRHLEGGGVAPDDGNVAKFRVYDAAVEALSEVAAGSGLACLIDDLHAADQASLELLVLVAGDLPRLPVFVAATLRDTEPSEALNRTLGELLTLRGAERLAVTPLAPDEVGALVGRALGEQPDPRVTKVLYERTGGNVFYLLELVRLLESEYRGRALTTDDVIKSEVPSGVRDVIARRVGRLPDNTRSVLTLAAIAGPSADLDLLEHAALVDSEQLMLALEPAVAAGLLATDDSRWGYRFRHPLIQESIHSGVSSVDRSRLHARVAASLEALPDGGRVGRPAQLAYHYLAAGRLGDPVKAVTYCRSAAQAASQVGAWGEAVRLLNEALGAVGQIPSDSAATRCDVLVELGRVYRAGSRIVESHEALRLAIELADRIGDEERVLSAAVAFGSVSLWGSRAWGKSDPYLVGVLERQLTRLGDTEDGRMVRVLSTLATELHFDEDAELGVGYGQKALALARRLGDPATLGIAVTAYLHSTRGNNRLGAIVPVIEEFLGRPELGLGADVEAVLRLQLLTERLRYAELARFDAEVGRCRELARDVLHSTELEGQVSLVEACRALFSGDPEAVRQWADSGLRMLEGASSTWSEPFRFVLDSGLLLLSNNLADNAEVLEERALHPSHVSVPHLAFPAAALGYALRGDYPKAGDIAAEWFAPPPMTWTYMQPLAYWAQVAYLVGQPDPSSVYEELLPYSGELALVGNGVDVGGAVDSLLAGLALRLGRREEALERAQAGLALERRAQVRRWFDRTAALIDAARC